MKFAGRFLGFGFLSLLIFVFGCVGQSSRSLDAAVGQLSSSQMFVLKDLEGKDVSLETILKQNKAVLLNFWATWCPPCREEIPDLIKLQSQYGQKDFTILGVDVGESQKKVSAFAGKAGINYPVVLDQSQSAAEDYRVVGIPTSFLVDPEGKVIGEYHGFTKQLVQDIEKIVSKE